MLITDCLVFLVAFTLACVGALVFQCVPVEAVWNFELKAQANCFSGETYTSIGLFNSSKCYSVGKGDAGIC